MHNRIVQYPNRIKLVPVSGQPDTYDIVAIPGEVVSEGTPLNKATLLSDETGLKYGLTSDGTVDDALGRNLTIRTIQVPASGWNEYRDDEGYVWQQISVEGMQAEFNPIASLSNDATQNQKIYWEYVKAIETGNGYVIVKAINKTLVDLTIELKGV